MAGFTFRTLILAIFLVLCAAVLRAQRGPAREIIKISDNLYRTRNGTWYGLVYVTPDGILLADPISTDFAGWVKSELDRRFPGIPIRYIVYSHSHWDHIEGAAVFGDGPKVVAQEGVLRNMDGRYPHMPGDMIDRNNNGQFELEEIVGPGMAHPGICGMPANFFQTHDRNHDGHMTPAEYYAEVRRPDIVYSDRMQLTLGGKTVELVFPGKNHADDGTVIVFPSERIAFAADFPADALVRESLRSLPSACGNFDAHPVSEWIRSYKTIESLDFDQLAGGHGSALFKKSDVAEARQFFEDLVASVSAGMAAGKSLDDLKHTILLEKYSGWAYYQRLREDNIEAAYNNLKIYK
ncbi:MAG TPA: MBL fold metallo-hydrolase [Terriglobia bacterium]|nr:MBL fold metallo-hydrolase [Terriglobia bacterium]